jgi:hypothetical protein
MNKISFLLKLTISIAVSFLLQSCQHNDKNTLSTSPVTEIAILMPMQGNNGTLGKECAELIRYGMLQTVNGKVNLTLYDASDEAILDINMNKIIKKNTKIILGSMSSATTAAIIPKAKQNGIIVITLSNNPALASKDEVYVFGHAPLKQLQRIVEYALDSGNQNLITLMPNTQSSVDSVNQIIEEMAVQKRVLLAKKEVYASTPESIDSSVREVSAKVDELNEEDEVKPILYINDDKINNDLFISSIKKYNLDKKAFLIADHKIHNIDKYKIDLTFTGSLNFINFGLENFQCEDISFLHILSFDLGRIVGSLLDDNEFLKQAFLAKLNSIKYVGASGNIQFIDGISQREYDIIKYQDGNYKTLENKNSIVEHK